MESPKNIKRIVIGLLCLSVLVLIALHVFQHQRFIKLSQETDSQLVANGAVSTAGTVQQTAKENAPVIVLGKEPVYDFKSLRAELSAQEQELEKADKKLNEIEARDNELKKASIDFESRFKDLFMELNLSHEKQEKFIDVFRKMGKSMPPILINPSADVPPQELEAAIKEYQDKFNAKLEESLGKTDYERYTAWNVRSESRDIVTNFSRLLSSDDQLTKDQEKVLVEIWYKEQGRADYEKRMNLKLTGPPQSDENTMAEEMKNTGKAYSKMIESAKSTLSASQLEQFKKYLQNQYAMLELQAKASNR